MKKRSILITQIGVFVFFLIYFTQISPLLPFDGDDWFFNGSMRVPFPLWGVWNPTRVFPEVLSPVCGYIAAFCLYPFTHDYVGAVGFVRALVVSGFVTVFFYLFYNLLKKLFKLSTRVSIASELFFILSFFLIFKHLNQASYTGFWSNDFDSMFFYLVPGLLNASVILWMAQYRNFHAKLRTMTLAQKGILVLVLYFALFSNTQFNIILATYSFFKVVEVVVKSWQHNHSLTQLLKSTYVYLMVLIVWLLTVIFDMHGARANSLSQGQPFTTLFKNTIGHFKLFISYQNTLFVLLGVLVIAISIICWCMGVRNNKKLVVFCVSLANSLTCLVLSTVYLLLAYTKAGSEYVSRVDAMWPIVFFFLYSFCICLSWMISESKIIKVLVPLGLTMLALLAFNFNYQLIPSTVGGYDAKTVKAVDNYIINQVVKADRNGKSKVVVKVPINDKNHNPKDKTSNWPHSYDMAGELQNDLYAHHLIRTRMKIIFKPDISVNHKFYENKSDEQPFISLE